MSETKFTPGPWIAAELTRRPCRLQFYWRVSTGEDRDSETIAVVPAEYPGDDAGEEADARLIASAPDLFQLLTESIDIMERQVDYSGELASILTRAKAVLAKLNS